MSQPYGSRSLSADRARTRVVELIWLLPELACVVYFSFNLADALGDRENSLFEIGVLFAGSFLAYFTLALVSTVAGLCWRRTWMLVTGKVLTVTGFLGGPLLLMLLVLIAL